VITCDACGAENTEQAEYCSLCFKPLGAADDLEAADPSEAAGPPPEGLLPHDFQAIPPFEVGPGPEEVHVYAPATAAAIAAGVPLSQVEAAPLPPGAITGPRKPPEGLDLSRAIKEPFEAPDWVGKALTGVLFWAIPFAVPATTGYLIRYIGTVGDGGDELPSWGEGFFSYWIKGFILGMITLAAMLPLIVVLVGAIVAGMGTGGRPSPAALSGIGVPFLLLGGLYGLAVSVVLTASIADYAVSDEFSAFLPWRAIRNIAARPRFLVVWLVSGGILVLAGMLSGGMSAMFGQDPQGGLIILQWLVNVTAGGAVRMIAALVSCHLLGQWAGELYGYGAAPRQLFVS
jgi:hypothetical protein